MGVGSVPTSVHLNLPYTVPHPRLASPLPSAQVSIRSRTTHQAVSASRAPPGYLRARPEPARPASSEAALRGGGSSGRRGAALARVDTRRRSGRSSLRLRRSLCALCARRARHSLPSRPCDTTSSKRARCFLGMKILPGGQRVGARPRLRLDRFKPQPTGAVR